MRLGVVGHLVAHAGREGKRSAISKFGMQFALDAKQDMAFGAPVIGQVACTIVDHAHADVAELACAPISHASIAFVLGLFDRGPVGGAEGDVVHLHDKVCPDLGATRYELNAASSD